MIGKLINKAIYLMPFTPKSILVFHLLCRNGIDILGFCDNDSRLSTKSFADKPICLPAKGYELCPEAASILCELKFFSSNATQLREIGFQDIITMDELSFSEELSDFIPMLNEDGYAELIPKQVPYGRRFVQILSDLKIWDRLLIDLKNDNIMPYCFKECVMASQPARDGQPSFLVCVNATFHLEPLFLGQCMDSLLKQKQFHITPLFVFISENEGMIKQCVQEKDVHGGLFLRVQRKMNSFEILEYARAQFMDYTAYDFAITLGANDTFAEHALAAFAEKMYADKSFAAFTANEDRAYNDEFIAPYYKQDYQKIKMLEMTSLVRNVLCIRTDFEKGIQTIKAEDIFVIEAILYHYRVLPGATCDNQIKPIAYYLPQFHAIPENDRWWGKDFTEWTNVKRGTPMFEGHYQPHVPGELGYYDLMNDLDIQKKQMDLARKHGIYGFCYYYYWFNGKKLLEKPLENVLRNPELDMPFCILWANENWTRRWDGFEQEVLMEQVHNDESDRQFILDVLPMLMDPRYIRVHGAPLLLIYRVDMFPDFEKTLQIWRSVAAEHGIPHLHISLVIHSFSYYHQALKYGCESVTEFPPHKSATRNTVDELVGFQQNFTGRVNDYRHYAQCSMNRRTDEEMRFRGIMLGFDNTARRMEKAIIYNGCNPYEYQKLFTSLVDFTSRQVPEERLIFINAWNEWAEGNHLEPDAKFGDAYLQATHTAISINC